MPVHHLSSFAPFFFFWLNSFLAVLKSPFHFCFTSSMVLLATPTALTFSVMGFHVSVLVLFVTLSVNLLCKMPLFASTFSVIIVNSRVVKFGFLFLFSALFPVCSSESMFTRLIQIQKNFVLNSLRSALTQGSTRALHLISRQTCLSGGNPLCWKIYSQSSKLIPGIAIPRINSASGNPFLFLV